MTVKSILDSLDKEQRRRLIHAFEQGFSQHVEYASGKFIGVNIQNAHNLKIDTEVGVWSIGEIQ
jgi:hypothetical protein